MTATRVWRWALSLLAGLFLVPLGVSTACAVATTNVHVYDVAPVYDDAARSVQAHTSEAAPVTSAVATEGAQGTSVTSTGPLSVLLLKSLAANNASRLLSPSSLAHEVATATGGVLKTNKGGFTIEIPNGSRGITVRVMERGGVG